MEAIDTLIFGIGNTLLADEGAGIHALDLLRLSYPELPGVAYIDGGTLSFTLAAYIEDCDKLIVLDATELNAPPGTVKTMVGKEMDAFLGAVRRSPHEVSLLNLFDIARLTESLPKERALIGIQPVRIEWGMHPTRPVKQGLGVVVNEVVNLLSKWHQAQKQVTGNCPEPPAESFASLLQSGMGK